MNSIWSFLWDATILHEGESISTARIARVASVAIFHIKERKFCGTFRFSIFAQKNSHTEGVK